MPNATWIAFALVVASCGAPAPENEVADGPGTDAHVIFAATVDGGGADAVQPGAAPEAATPDAMADATAPDASPDVAPPPCPDADGDGHRAAACGGDDCDDGDPVIHPGAPEICDGVDQNCDGHADDEGDPSASDLDSYCRQTAQTTMRTPNDVWNYLAPHCQIAGVRMDPEQGVPFSQCEGAYVASSRVFWLCWLDASSALACPIRDR